MSIGLGIVLFVIGAILAFALNLAVDWINLQLVGYILMIAGVVVIIFGIVLPRPPAALGDDLAHERRPRHRRPRRAQRALDARGPHRPLSRSLRTAADPERAAAVRPFGSFASSLRADRRRVAQRDRRDDRGRDHERDPDERGHDHPAVEGAGRGCRELGRRSTRAAARRR